MRQRIPFPLVLLLSLVLVFSLASTLWAEIAAQKTMPEDGAVVDRPVRSLRIWFDQAPDVEKSELTLTGPAGELKVEGMHTMGENDLMARVVGSMPDGEYTASWKAAGEDGEVATGEWKFTVQRGG